MQIPDDAETITRGLAVLVGDSRERDALIGSIYGDLARIARAELNRHRRSETLNTRALVNEAYLKLFSSGPGGYQNRKHFFATAARAMRQVIVDYARSRLAARRGSGAEHVEYDAHDLPVEAQAERLVIIDAALARLAEIDPRLVQVVELRFFAGMEVEEVAEVLGVSVPTIVRDTRLAKAFLAKELD